MLSNSRKSEKQKLFFRSFIRIKLWRKRRGNLSRRQRNGMMAKSSLKKIRKLRKRMRKKRFRSSLRKGL